MGSLSDSCVVCFLTCMSSSCDTVAVLSGVAPSDVPHTDLIMCPREALSPVGKEEIPGVGGSLSCEKSK